ncbi:MAG: DUF433 domain-containing protein [Chloroflexota bacterium]|nr:DUF433 domain-containing protein [Chloroflexota bacterium]
MVTTKARAISHNPNVLGGEPIVSGTRVPVRAIVSMERAYRGDLVAVQRALPTLSAEEIMLALRYERDHPDEIAGWMDFDADADAYSR